MTSTSFIYFKPENDPWGGHAPTCTQLDRDSVLRVFPRGTNQVMIYGLTHCLYNDVQSRILDMADDQRFPIQDVFNWIIAHPKNPSKMSSTLEGRDMNVIRNQPTDKWPQRHTRICKAALTDLVLENCKRYQEGLPLIPLGFVIDIDDNPEPLTQKAILERTSDPKRITPFELRHLHKLMNHKDPIIAIIARATVVFLKMKKGKEKGSYYLEKVKSPLDAETSALLKKRQATSKSKPKEARYDWRKQMASHLSDWSKLKYQS